MSYFLIQNLQLRFGKFQLGPIHLSFNKNDYLVLLGPTGCGKTSLLKSIAGFSERVQGSMLIDGEDIGILPPNHRNIGFVTQTADLFPHLTVEQNIHFGLDYLTLTRTEKKHRIQHYLDLFNLTMLRNQSVLTLSGGESKRTALARSLITQPKILLLDEPLGMLDHNGRKEMIHILKRIHDELKTTTIHVTHDRKEAWIIAQQCAVMNNGKICQTGTVYELFRYSDNCFTADFLGSSNIFKAEFLNQQIKTSWGNFQINKKFPLSNGWIMIRPELIQLSTEIQPHLLSGIIHSCKDFGEYIELEISIGQPEQLIVHAPILQINQFTIGKTVYLNWDAEAVHPIFKE